MSHTEARDFRKRWSHKPTPIPPDAGGLWYSEECVDQMLADYAAQLVKERDGLILLLTNCRNGLELLLASHEPDRPDDPWDTINELHETVRASTKGIYKARAALAAESTQGTEG